MLRYSGIKCMTWFALDSSISNIGCLFAEALSVSGAEAVSGERAGVSAAEEAPVRRAGGGETSGPTEPGLPTDPPQISPTQLHQRPAVSDGEDHGIGMNYNQWFLHMLLYFFNCMFKSWKLLQEIYRKLQEMLCWII